MGAPEYTFHNQQQHDQEKWTRGIPTTLRSLTEETWKHLRHRKRRLESGMRVSFTNLKIVKPSTQILAKFKMHQHQREYQKNKNSPNTTTTTTSTVDRVPLGLSRECCQPPKKISSYEVNRILIIFTIFMITL